MFFYDNELKLYINDEPLLISSKAQKAAKALGFVLKWDNNGHIHKISQGEVKALCAKLDIVMLTVQDFMHLAKRESRVASPNFAEWLDDTFELLPDGRMAVASGEVLHVPESRPGWFQLDTIGPDGFPTNVSLSPGAGKWKFWTQGDPSFKAGAVRSFVTSSGTCSLDLGIPSFARHPNFMIRECYKSQPLPFGNPIDTIWVDYERKTHQRNDAAISEFLKGLDINKLTLPGDGVDGFLSDKNKERAVDLIGKKRLLEGNFAGLQVIDLATMVSSLSPQVDENSVYVTGHDHPDADAVVGAVFEAVRRQITYENTCVPWLQRVPFVVRHILGTEICDALSKIPKYGPTNDIVLVDCHSFTEGHDYQVKAIIDHHIVNRTFPYYVSISQEVSWSSTIQIYIKFLGSGLDLDSHTAKILLEATMVEAEPSLMDKMSELDRAALARLKTLAQGNASYPTLMGLLTRDTMSGDPFWMDYKEGLYGFSVIKTQQAACYSSQAKENNQQRHLPLTVVKQVVYDAHFQRIEQETLSMYFNEGFHDKGFKKAIIDAVKSACVAMHGSSHVFVKGYEVRMSDIPHQTPRLLLAPLLEEIVKEHLRFFKSKAINMYVACGFYTEERGDYGRSDEAPTVTTGLSYADVKSLLVASFDITFMTLPQYWKVYHECQAINDSVALKSLRDPKYVEVLDTTIYQCIEVEHGGQKRSHPTILEAKPALIRTEDINSKTGFPKKLMSPDNYGDNSMWRYWSPDRDENVATRGHIFVMNQTCIDLKIGPRETTKQLTFRPIYRDIPALKYDIQPTEDGKWVNIRVFPRLFSVKHGSSPIRRRLSVTKLAHDVAKHIRAVGKDI